MNLFLLQIASVFCYILVLNRIKFLFHFRFHIAFIVEQKMNYIGVYESDDTLNFFIGQTTDRFLSIEF